MAAKQATLTLVKLVHLMKFYTSSRLGATSTFMWSHDVLTDECKPLFTLLFALF